MICELFPFQKQAVNEMRLRVAMALNNYRTGAMKPYFQYILPVLILVILIRGLM